MKIHERIRALRQSKGISQAFIADQLGISDSGYNMKELGNRPIKAEELQIIANSMGVSASIFFDDKFHVKCNNPKEVS